MYLQGKLDIKNGNIIPEQKTSNLSERYTPGCMATMYGMGCIGTGSAAMIVSVIYQRTLIQIVHCY